ncbi:TPA: hypothetical protein ACIBC4_000782 [Salmonella enterica subsp. enterica serovar Potsdam]
MKENQITVSMAKDIAFSIGADLDDEEAGIFADGYNVAMHKVNKNASTELPNDANLSTNSPIIPEEIPKGLAGQIVSLLAHNIGDKFLAQKIWNACRAAMLQGAEPVSQTYNLPELIEGMEVSIDVSTCDADAGNRYFGTVTEVSELDTAKNGYILLVQDAKPNFDVNGNSPVIPEGYALVPIEATEEMLQASYRESSVYSPSAYRAMIAAAPQQEEK